MVAKAESKPVVVAPPTPPPLTEVPIESLTAEEKIKRAKAIRKKLKQIAEVKEKVVLGVQLNEDQQNKLNSEAGLLEDLEKLEPV